MSQIIPLILFTLLPVISFAKVETKEFSAQGLKDLDVKNLSGDIRITPSSNDKASVTSNKMTFEENCVLEIEREGDQLEVEVKRQDLFGSDVCEVHLDIKVPKKISLNLKTGSGDIEVEGTEGEVEFETGSGNASVNAEVDELDANLGSGDLSARGLRGDVKVKTGSGDINLDFASAPQAGKVSIKTGSGDTTLSMPSTAKILTHFKSGSGQVYNELGDTENARLEVSMQAGSGDLKILKAKK